MHDTHTPSPAGISVTGLSVTGLRAIWAEAWRLPGIPRAYAALMAAAVSLAACAPMAVPSQVAAPITPAANASNAANTSAAAQALQGAPVRIELHPVSSRTVDGDAFLRGDTGGKPVALAGELRIPVGKSARYPVVVMIHGSGGVSGSMDYWVHQLNAGGIGTFVVDSFTGRGIVSTAQDQTQLHSLAMMIDAYRALDLLATHPRVDASKIAVMGFSKGAVASIFSASNRFRQAYGSQARFAAHIGLYTPCNTRFIGDTEVGSAPMRLFHGTTDDYVSVAPCREFVSQLRARGVDALLTEYPDSEHGYDNPLSPRKVAVPTSQTTRNCQLVEASVGRVVNASTRQPFGYADSCVSIGAHIGHNPESTVRTWRAVVEFMQRL